MRHRRIPVFRIAIALAILFWPAVPATAEEKIGWSDQAELSFVATDGNSELSTLGFKNKLRRKWEKSAFELNAGGLRAETTTLDAFAVGTTGSFRIDEITTTETTAENYYLNARYERNFSDRLFWFGGVGWGRSEDAGIRNRYNGSFGFGNVWVERERAKFLTDYSATYTDQEDIVTNPTVDETFIGFRFSWKFEHKVGENSTYGNDLILDANLDETDDFRGDMTNWFAVAINKRLALKVSLQWLFDNQPSFEEIPLFDLPLSDPLAMQTGTVPRELDDLDTIFTASLVVNF